MKHLNLKKKLVGLLGHHKKSLNRKNLVLQIIKIKLKLKLIKQERHISTDYRYIFHIYCQHIYNHYVARGSLFRSTCRKEDFSKNIISV